MLRFGSDRGGVVAAPSLEVNLKNMQQFISTIRKWAKARGLDF